MIFAILRMNFPIVCGILSVPFGKGTLGYTLSAKLAGRYPDDLGKPLGKVIRVIVADCLRDLRDRIGRIGQQRLGFADAPL